MLHLRIHTSTPAFFFPFLFLKPDNQTNVFFLHRRIIVYSPLNKSTTVPWQVQALSNMGFAVPQHMHDNEICNNPTALTINQY